MLIRVETALLRRGIGVGRSAAVVLAVLWMAAPLRAQAVNEYPIGNTALPQGVTLGPDGNLWFAELLGRIGRMTPSGVVTEFPIPTVGSSPQDIVAGPDGALWFTENGKNQIGRITTAGDFTEFPIPTAASSSLRHRRRTRRRPLVHRERQPTRSAASPPPASSPSSRSPPPDPARHDHRDRPRRQPLVHRARARTRSAGITTAGVFTEFPIPTAGDNPEGITAGRRRQPLVHREQRPQDRPDHDRRRRSPSSPCPSRRRAFRIAAGPDGNLWFTEFDNNKIGRITTAGVITEFLIPTVRLRALRHHRRARRTTSGSPSSTQTSSASS